MRCFLLSSLLMLPFLGCATKLPQSQTNAVAPQVQNSSTATVKPTPYTFPKLTEAESVELDEALPKIVRRVLEQSEVLELFSIQQPCFTIPNPRLKPVTPNKFQGCTILKRVALTDSLNQRELLDGLDYGIGTASGGVMCKAPEYGIRGVHHGERVELLISFGCQNFQGVTKSVEFGGNISPTPAGLFNHLLSENARE